jgi:transcriptional regulator with XRE-family HTH domain
MTVVQESRPVRSEPIGALIRQARQEAGKSQAALAEQLRDRSGNSSVTREYVSRWESGKRVPTPFWRQHIALALSLSRDQIDRACAVSIRHRSR